MKTRLLRKLRKKCCKKYCITKNGGTFKVWFGREDTEYYLENSLVDAKECMKKLVCKDIKDELFKIRYKRRRSHCIKYYPWIIMCFLIFTQTRVELYY
jgi:hypothetical protein